MPAIVNTIITGLISKQAGGVSMTRVGAHAGVAAGILASLGPALNGDPASIGLLVLAVGSWLITLIGRSRADKRATTPKEK